MQFKCIEWMDPGKVTEVVDVRWSALLVIQGVPLTTVFFQSYTAPTKMI